jgi:hypothetical protein
MNPILVIDLQNPGGQTSETPRKKWLSRNFRVFSPYFRYAPASLWLWCRALGRPQRWRRMRGL